MPPRRRRYKIGRVARRSRIYVLRESKPFKESFEEQRGFSAIRTNRQPSSFVAQDAATRGSLRALGVFAGCRTLRFQGCGFSMAPPQGNRARFWRVHRKDEETAAGLKPGATCVGGPPGGSRYKTARTPQGPLTPKRRMWCIFGRRLERPEGKSGAGRRDTMRPGFALALTKAAGIPVLASAALGSTKLRV